MNRLWVLGSVAVAGLLQVLFALTYPINTGASDNPAYLEMIRSGSSNLILASGYPYLVHLALAGVGVPPPEAVFDVTWLGQIQALQNSIHFSFVVAFAWLGGRVFGDRVAGLFVMVLGTSTLFLGGLNSAAPEWLQGDLIALSLLLAATSFMGDRRKVYLYGAAFVLATLAYLIRPTSLVIAPFLLLIVLVDATALRRKMLSLTVGGLAAGGLLMAFVTFVHLPSTGARQLNYDHAWILTTALPGNYLSSPPEELGIYALRWRAMSALVPPRYELAGPFPTVMTGASAEERGAYLERYREVMQLSRPDLVRFVEGHPLPSSFQQSVSAIPLYWYLGFQEVDDLGIQVFEESISVRWRDYVQRVAHSWAEWGALRTDIVPFFGAPMGLRFGLLEPNGRLRYDVPEGEPGPFMRYWHPAQALWSPGVAAFQYLSALILPRFAEIALALVSIAQILSLAARKRLVAAIVLAAILALATTGFLLVGVRDKEFISLLPSLALVYAFGLVGLLSLIGRLRDRLVARQSGG